MSSSSTVFKESLTKETKKKKKKKKTLTYVLLFMYSKSLSDI